MDHQDIDQHYKIAAKSGTRHRKEIGSSAYNECYYPQDDDPYRSLARKLLTTGFLDPALRVRSIAEEGRKIGINGCILCNHGFGRCSMADSSFAKHLREELNKAGIPLLILDGDCVDTTIDPCSTETKISAYVEALNLKKYGNIFGRLKGE